MKDLDLNDHGSNGRSKKFSNPNSASKSQWNSKSLACLRPLQPLSIVRSSIHNWSDNINSLTPREVLTSNHQDLRTEKLACFNKECSRILNHIYLGSNTIAKNREVLRENGITHILNCVGYTCPEYFNNELVYKTLWLKDSPSEDITSILYDVFDYFEEVEDQGGRVFVHCFQGVSRSSSLVIAYLMWKEMKNFEDAFKKVKEARQVTNPNLGFACQLLQYQKRIFALPPSPSSAIRMYQMAPHSSYDPLHLVPKMVYKSSTDKLDSRGAFIIHTPSALFIWIGKYCTSVMSDNALAAASQVIRYERIKVCMAIVREGEETDEFWDALSSRRSGTDGSQECCNQYLSSRKVAEYDADFNIFHGALSGGVLPSFPLSESASETCLPVFRNASLISK